MAMFPSWALLKSEGIRYQRQPAVNTTEMESGPPKQARRLSRVMVRRQLTYIFPDFESYNLFIDWFTNDIGGGSAWFDWIDPVDAKIKKARIMGGVIEEMSNSTYDVWEILMTIETWG